MSSTFKGVQSPIGTKDNPGAADQNRTPGSDQQQPLPNENQQNQPLSSAKTMNPDGQKHQWNDTPPEAGLSDGVTEGHHNVQQAKHSKSGEATSKSSTGQPEKRDHDGTPPSVKNRDSDGNS